MTMLPPDAQGRRAARYELMKRSLIVFTAALVTVVLGVLVYQVNQGTQTIHAVRSSQQSNHILLDTIQDCTQPAGECYRRGQQRTAAAVGDINRVIILAAACASSLPTGLTIVARQNAIQSCVISGLAHKP